MNERIKQMQDQIVKLWGETSNTKKLIFGSLSVAILVAFVLSIQQVSKPDFQPLFTGLDSSEAATITEKLKEQKITYQLADNGATILVPSNVKDETRLLIANEGLPTGGVVGFEIFDETRFGETDTDRRAKYQRALQGELTRTIEQLAEVKNARVHVVMPEQRLFSEDQEETTASIMLELMPFKKLNPEQITGLVRLVASSVEGLKAENVTIVDSNMNNLTEGVAVDSPEIASNKLTATQLEMQKLYQKDIEKSAQSMLEKILGPGKAVVRVNAELDFDRVELTKEDYGDKVVRSEQIQEESGKGENSGTPSGPVGTDSNVGPTYETITETSNSEYEKSNIVKNYEIDNEKEHRVVAPGKIKKLSAAVVVDGAQIQPEQQEAIKSAVTMALGIDETRGDQVSVTAIPFNTTYLDELRAAEEAQAQKERLINYGIVGAVVLLIGFILFRAFRRKPNTETDELIPNDVMTVEDLMANREETPEERERAKVIDEIEKLAQQNPGDVAQILKSWLTEE